MERFSIMVMARGTSITVTHTSPCGILHVFGEHNIARDMCLVEYDPTRKRTRVTNSLAHLQ